MCYEEDYVPTLRDWAAYRLQPLNRLGRRIKRWWKYSVLKKPRPQPKCSLDLTGFDAFLKEVYPATAVECIASAKYPLIQPLGEGRGSVVPIWYGNPPRFEDE